MKRDLRRYIEIARNLLVDLRYGAYLGRPTGSRFDHLGAHPVAHTDYRVLRAIFRDRPIEGEVLVDVGCGKGRVIHYWLSRGFKNRLIGIELDAEIAAQVRKRLRRFANVEIVAGSAVENLPTDGTVFFLSNPFDKKVILQFKRSIAERSSPATLLYYNSVHVEAFRDDPAWLVEEIDLAARLPKAYVSSTNRVLPFAVLRFVS